MEAPYRIYSIVLVLSISGILLFLLNPLIIRIVYIIKGRKTVKYSSALPPVSFVIVTHNAAKLISDKINNSLSIDYPVDRREIIVFSDGSTDETESRVRPFCDKKVYFLSSPYHEGKNSAINKAVDKASGEILVFSDVDAILEPKALLELVKYFGDPDVGGVCGQRVIAEDRKELKRAQSDYIRVDSTIKKLESSVGSISSNDGKLYAIRRCLFKPIPSSVTDDLYACLSVVKQGYRFLFEPHARAFIAIPSRNPGHEIKRRRRIVSTSLRGIFLMRELLNPLKYGLFSISLIINKIVRRFLPVFLVSLFLSSLALCVHSPLIGLFLLLQLSFYILAFAHWALLRHLPGLRIVKRLSSLAFYFCLGNYGTLLGLIDFLRGKRIIKWEPSKLDG